MSEAREQLFDEWAASYDESVDGYSGFPFEGYEQVLDLIAERARVEAGGPIGVDRHFDGVVAAYVLHEFDLESKIRLLRKRVCDHLVEGGRVVVGDISFPTRAVRDEAEKRFSGTWDEERQRWEGCLWDEDEHYWAADEAIEALAAVGLTACYGQVSFCGGVYVIERTGAESTDDGRSEET